MRIIFTGGGTLGPVTPLIATIEAIKELKPDLEPIWVGTRAGVERKLIVGRGIRYFWIPSGKLRRYLDLRNILAPFIIFAGFFSALILIIRLRPKAVVGAGGFVQVPLMFAARALGVPVIVHQQDLEAGLANRLAGRVASKITAVFPEAQKQFAQNVEVVGNPCRAAIAELNDPVKRAIVRERGLELWGFSGAKPIIVFLGGGTGGSSLNELIVQNLDKLLASAEILHMTGSGKMNAVEKDGYVPQEFFGEKMPEAYAVADLVVCRAGMGTITELGTLGLPAVLAPFRGHQEKNAAYFAERGAALALSSDVSSAVFSDTVLRLLADRDRRLLLGQKLADLFPPDGAKRLAQVVLTSLKN